MKTIIKSPEKGTTKSTRKVSTAKTITNNLKNEKMVTKTTSTESGTKKPVTKRATASKKVKKEFTFPIVLINKQCKTKEDRQTVVLALNEILKQLEMEIALEEVVLIEKAFNHIRLSSRHYGLPTGELFSFFGYLPDSAHHEAIRELKMTEEERSIMPWKFRDREAKSKNLVRYQALSDYYHSNIVSHYSDVEQPLSLEHVAELIAIAKPLMVYVPKEAKA